MIVTLKYFAWVRERVGLSHEQVDLPPHVKTIADTIVWLKGRGANYATAFERDDIIRAALDHSHATKDALIDQACELAFFPPITGG